VATDLLIIHDEIDLKFGFLKQAFDSRAAGHNGVKSIIAELGTQEFNRIRIGVESRKSRLESPTDEYVLKQFSTEDLRVLQESIFPEVKTLVEKFIQS
jgi:PTH1 family peptidyl-tRNA hydrolase